MALEWKHHILASFTADVRDGYTLQVGRMSGPGAGAPIDRFEVIGIEDRMQYHYFGDYASLRAAFEAAEVIAEKVLAHPPS